jgi:hypothetical protein
MGNGLSDMENYSKTDYKKIVTVQYTHGFKYDGCIPFSMVTLDVLLSRNYKELKDPGCVDAVLTFLRTTPSVAGCSPVFIKQLTKVGSHILKEYPEKLDGLLLRLFHVTSEGIQVVRDMPARETFSGIAPLHSHLHAHLADFAMELFERTGDMSHARTWYQSRVQAADLNENLDPKYAADQHSFAVDAARRLYKETGKMEWAEKARGHALFAWRFYTDLGNVERAASLLLDLAYIQKEVLEKTGTIEEAKKLHKHFIKAAEAFYDLPKTFFQSAIAYNEAANAAEFIQLKLKKKRGFDAKGDRVIWLERQLDCLGFAAVQSIKDRPELAMVRYGIRRKVAEELYIATGRPIWLEEMYDSCASAAIVQELFDIAGAAKSLTFVADTALKVFEKTRVRDEKGKICKDPFWAEQAYKHRMQAIELFESVGNRKEAMHSHSYAGDIAKGLYEETDELHWAEKWYETRREAADSAKALGDKKHASFSYLYAGEAAQELVRKVRDCDDRRAHLKNAIHCYERFRTLCPVRHNRELSRQVQNRLRFLRQDVHRCRQR